MDVSVELHGGQLSGALLGQVAICGKYSRVRINSVYVDYSKRVNAIHWHTHLQQVTDLPAAAEAFSPVLGCWSCAVSGWREGVTVAALCGLTTPALFTERTDAAVRPVVALPEVAEPPAAGTVMVAPTALALAPLALPVVEDAAAEAAMARRASLLVSAAYCSLLTDSLLCVLCILHIYVSAALDATGSLTKQSKYKIWMQFSSYNTTACTYHDCVHLAVRGQALLLDDGIDHRREFSQLLLAVARAHPSTSE